MWLWQRCPWLLICVAVCLLLDYPTYSRQQAGTAIYKEDYPNHPDCNTFGTLGDYFNNEAGKNVTCPYFLSSGTTESDPPTSSTNLCPRPPDFLPPLNVNISVSWCYTAAAYHLLGIGTVTLCINATGDRDVSYSFSETPELVNHIENISVLDDGRLLHFPESSFTNFLRFSEVNCTVIAESDDQLQQCGVDEFHLIILDRTRTAEDHMPSILSTSREEDLEVNIGEQLRWCVSGGSLGVHDLQWAWSQNPSLETVNITANVSGPPCLNCECAQSAYYDLDIVQRYLRNTSMGGARGVAFSVLGYEVPIALFAKSWQCSGVPTNYLSFVIIDEVEPGDNETELMINVTSFTGESMQRDYAIHTPYQQISPTSNGPTVSLPTTSLSLYQLSSLLLLSCFYQML